MGCAGVSAQSGMPLQLIVNALTEEIQALQLGFVALEGLRHL